MDSDTIVSRIRAQVAQIKAIQDAETDHPSYCVVPNRQIDSLLRLWAKLDEGLLTALLVEPSEWRHGCPYARGGELGDVGGTCPTHGVVHEVSIL